ncbi:MAG: hypothetical protein AAB652_01390 [Patescibacteria group bacterium]
MSKSLEDLKGKELLRFESAKEKESTKFDNIVFVAATGTFVLSINYIVGIKTNYLHYHSFLVLAWIFLLTAIIVHADGYRESVIYHQDFIDKLNKWNANHYQALSRSFPGY